MASSYSVPLIPQTTNMSCWAASIAMILSWKQRRTIPDEVIARNTGGRNYAPYMATGLNPNDVYILNRNGFVMESPRCYTPRVIMELLHAFGPLWVASAVPTPHIRVVSGVTGINVELNDPSPVGSGSKYKMPIVQLFGAMESLGARELGQRAPIYVAHLKA